MMGFASTYALRASADSNPPKLANASVGGSLYPSYALPCPRGAFEQTQ